MALDLTRGFGRNCKTGLGGLKRVYLFPFVKRARRDVVLEGQTLQKLITYPETIIYPFELEGNYAFTQTPVTQNGNISWQQKLDLNFQKIYANTELEKLLKKDYQAIVETRAGKFIILGLFNGGTFTRLAQVTGDSKTSFNGYQLSYEAIERNQAYFIDDLVATGFVETFITDYLLLEDSTPGTESFLYLENGLENKIILDA